jgi:SAM-dependent methyltransferase
LVGLPEGSLSLAIMMKMAFGVKAPLEKERPIYDIIGEGYNLHRKTDSAIFSQILTALSGSETVLNIGAGTGCYEPAKCTLAVEPSLKMIAQRSLASAYCVQGVAERLPLADKSFDGSLASLTIHHWSDIAAGLREMSRVTRKRIVIVTWDPEFDDNFWLTRDYLPGILELDKPRFPTIAMLEKILGGVEVQAVPIREDCQDGFIAAYWKRPAAFLDPLIQRANSAMAQLDRAIVQRGIDRLRDDLKTGRWLLRNAELHKLSSVDLGHRLIISDQSEDGD